MNTDVSQKVKYADEVTVTVPGLNGTLMPFQEKGVSWLYAVERGILADDVGLGKTITALGAAA